ncbi:MAG: SDR family NAD(P)-dependent oxidoreductase [Syntrophobacteraceae bacterium]|jgi:NADP-dependent 3-hydroxy acid dehydrogenase YdfG
MKGSWALVTGASAGMGMAIARALAARGVNLLVNARRESRLLELREELSGKYGVRVEPLVFDIRDPKRSESVLKAMGEVVSEVSILVNNAGLGKGTGPLYEASIADWDQTIDTNIKGLLYMTRLILPHMVKRNAGHIVNIGSVGGRWTLPGGVVYCATKFAVRAITDGLRMDLIGKKIRVTNIEPGLVKTEFSLVRAEGDKAKAEAVYEGYDPLQPEDIAEAVIWCLDRPPRVNIQELVVFPTDQVGVGQMYLHRRQV